MQPVVSALQTLITSKRQKPISRITVYDTAKTVPSLGFKCAYYLLDDNSAIVNGGDNWFGTSGNNYTDLATGVSYQYPDSATKLDNIIEYLTTIAFDWGVGGSPPGVGRGHLFAARWYGFFFARYGGRYRFYADTARHSRVRIKFNGSYLNWRDPDYTADIHTATFTDNSPSNDTIVAQGVGSPYSIFKANDIIVIGGTGSNNITATVGSVSSDGRTITLNAAGVLTNETNVTTVVISRLVTNWTSPYLSSGTKKELFAETVTLPKGSFYSIQVEFWVPEMRAPAEEPTFLCVKYREPNAVTDLNEWGQTGGVTDYQSDYPQIKPLSAGVVNCSKADGTLTGVGPANVGFLTGSVLAGVRSIRGSRSIDQAAEYTFEVPMPNATTLAGGSSGGGNAVIVKSVDGFPDSGVLTVRGTNYRYVSKNSLTNTFTLAEGESFDMDNHTVGDVVHLQVAGDYPYNPADGSYGAIREFRLCRIEIGYEDFTTPTPVKYYADRIWGFIYPEPTITRNKDTDVLQVKVSDFRILLLGDYFRNYPDFASYAVARYYRDHLLTEPDGIDRPVTYDRWNGVAAIRDILIKANIDPVLLFGRQHKAVLGGANFAAEYGDYLIDARFRLDAKNNYGNPLLPGEDRADDAYNWFFGYGTFLMRGVAEIAQNYLYRFGFQPDGKAYFQPVNSPSGYINDSGLEDNSLTYSTTPVLVTSPDGGEKWQLGQTHNILWNSDSLGNVKIELYWSYYITYPNPFGGPVEYYTEYHKHPTQGDVVASTADNGSYAWTIPATLPVSRNGQAVRYKIKITETNDTTNYALSKNFFTLQVEAE